MSGTVAVCLGGLLHNLAYTAESIQKYLLDPLEADLFLYAAIDQNMSAFPFALYLLLSYTQIIEDHAFLDLMHCIVLAVFMAVWMCLHRPIACSS